jgi:mRNA interferase MazF
VRRGEIWWATLPAPVGSEPAKRRPVLIISADDFNRSKIATVTIAVITGNVGLEEAPGNVRLSRSESGLDKSSVVNVSQISTVNRDRLTHLVRMLPSAVLERIDDGLRVALALPRAS